MNKNIFYLAMFIILVNLALFALAEDGILNETNASTETDIPSETVINETPDAANESANLVCDEAKCDEGCVLCSDNKCHEQEFACAEELSIEKIFPESIDIGVTQINALIKNTGNVDLRNISIALSGEGISTLEKIPIESLASGDKDYSFIKIKAAKAGAIDLVVKLYINNILKTTLVKPLTVLEEKTEAANATKVNVTKLTNNLNGLKERYTKTEQEYQNKKLEGYPVDILYDKLKETNDYLKDAQFYLVEEDYKKIELDLIMIKDNLDSIENELKNIKKKEVTFTDKVKGNMIYIGSIAAAIVSIFTAYNLLKGSVNKQKIMELHKKIKLKEKEEKKEELKEEQKEKNDSQNN